MSKTIVDENEVAELARAENEAKIKEKCVKVYEELELACEFIKKDQEAEHLADVRSIMIRLNDMKYLEFAEEHLPKLYKRFMKLQKAWHEKDYENYKKRQESKPASLWKLIFG